MLKLIFHISYKKIAPDDITEKINWKEYNVTPRYKGSLVLYSTKLNFENPVDKNLRLKIIFIIHYLEHLYKKIKEASKCVVTFIPRFNTCFKKLSI